MRRALAIAALVGCALGGLSAARAEIIEGVIATVNDEPIFLSELRQQAAPFLPRIYASGSPAEQQANIDALFSEILEKLIDQELIEQAAREMQVRVTSADERFRLEVRARGQIAYDVRGPDDWRHQIQIRRARLQLSGYTFSPNVRFKLEIALSPADVGISDSQVDGVPTRSPLLDFYVDFRHLRDLQVRVGQYKVPSNRQRVISSGNLQLVDRSILNAEMTLDRDVGFDLRSADFLGLGKLRYYAGVYMGRGRGARGYDDFGLMYLGRVEVLPFGLFDDYVEGDFDRTGPRLSLGAGYVHVDRARRNRGILGDVPVDGGTTDTHHLFVDAHFKARGFSLLAEWSWRSGARIAGGRTLQPAHDHQERGFARPGSAGQRDALPLLDLQRNAAQNIDGSGIALEA